MLRQQLIRLSFTEGVKRSFDPLLVPETALWDARNVRADESGVLRIRRGWETLTERLGSSPVQAAVPAFGKMLIAWQRGLYLVDKAGSVELLESNVAGNTDYDLVEFVPWSRNGKEVVYVFAGNRFLVTDGVSVTDVEPYVPEEGESGNLLLDSPEVITGCTTAVLRVSFGQRLAVAGNPSTPNTVYLSAPLDATYWPADQVIQLPDNGDRIVALANWYGTLIIMRENDIYAFFGADVTDSSAALVLQVFGTGCIARRTVVGVPGVGLVFLGRDNVYALRNVEAIERMATVTRLGDDILVYLQKELSSKFIKWANGFYYNNEYYLCLPWTATPLCRLSFQHNKGWYFDTQPHASVIFNYGGNIVAGLWEHGQLLQYSNKLFDVTDPIRYYVAFKRELLAPGPVRLKKVFVYALSKGRRETTMQYWFGDAFNNLVYGAGTARVSDVILGSEQHLDVTLVVDGNEFITKAFPVRVERINTLKSEDLEPVMVYETVLHPSLKGHFVQVRVTAGKQGEDIALLGYGLEYEPKRFVKGRRNSGD